MIGGSRVLKVLAAVGGLAVLAGCTVTSSSTADGNRTTYAQHTYTGRLVDAAGAPVAGATVAAQSSYGSIGVRGGLSTQYGGGTTARTGADGRFSVGVSSYGDHEDLLLTTSDRGSVEVVTGGPKDTNLGDLRLWAPALTVDQSSGPVARYGLADAPVGSASYALLSGQTGAIGQRGSLDLRLARPGTGRADAVVVTGDGFVDTSKPSAIAYAATGSGGHRRELRWSTPVSLPVAAGLPATCAVVSGNGFVAAPCASASGAALKIDLGSVRQVSSVSVAACGFSCVVQTSTDGRTFDRYGETDASLFVTDVTARYLLVGNTFAVDDAVTRLTDPAFGSFGRTTDFGSPTSGVVVYGPPAPSGRTVSEVIASAPALGAYPPATASSVSHDEGIGLHKTTVGIGVLVIVLLGFLTVLAGPSAAIRRRVTLPTWARLGDRPPSLTRAVFAHLGLFLGFQAAGGLIATGVRHSHGGGVAALALLAVAALVVGEVLQRRADRLVRTLGGFATLLGVAYGAVAVGYGFRHGTAAVLVPPLLALVAFGVLYVPRRTGWMLIGLVGSAVTLLVSALELHDGGLPSPVYGGYLAVLGLFLAAGVRAGQVRPDGLGRGLAGLLLIGGVATTTSGGHGAFALVLPVLFAVGCLGVARYAIPGLLPVLLVVGVFVLPGPFVVGVGGYGFLLALLVVGSLVVATACYLERVTADDVPVRVGGTVAFGTGFALIGSFAVDAGSVAVSLAALAALALVLVATGSVRRTAPAILAGVVLLIAGVGKLGLGLGNGVSGSLVLLAVAAVVVVVAVRGRGPRLPRQISGKPLVPLGFRAVPGAPDLVFTRVIAVAGEQGHALVKADARTGSLVVGALEVSVVAHPDGAGVTVGGAPEDMPKAQALLAALAPVGETVAP